MLLSALGRINLFNPGSQQSWQGSRNTRILLPRDNFSTNLHFCYCPPFPDGHPASPAHSFCGAALPLFYPTSSLTSLFCSHSTHFPNLCLVSFFFLIALNMSLYISQQQIYLNVSMLLLSRSDCALPFQPPSESHVPLPRAPQHVWITRKFEENKNKSDSGLPGKASGKQKNTSKNNQEEKFCQKTHTVLFLS